MEKTWTSQQTYEHPSPYWHGVMGTVRRNKFGTYIFYVGKSCVNCPQPWAADIHNKELLQASIDEDYEREVSNAG